jgi:hypothetical protein
MKMDTTVIPPSVGSHSAAVEMWLHTAGKTFPVFQSSEHEIKVERSADIPLGEAVLEIVIDGQVHRHQLRIITHVGPNGWVGIALASN